MGQAAANRLHDCGTCCIGYQDKNTVVLGEIPDVAGGFADSRREVAEGPALSVRSCTVPSASGNGSPGAHRRALGADGRALVAHGRALGATNGKAVPDQDSTTSAVEVVAICSCVLIP